MQIQESRYAHCSGIHLKDINIFLDGKNIQFKGKVDKWMWNSPDYCDLDYFDKKLGNDKLSLNDLRD